MAIQILSGATSDVLTVDPTSKAARVTLYDTAGNALGAPDGSSLPAAPRGLLILGDDKGVGRAARLDSGGAVAQARSTLLLFDPIDGTALNTLTWTSTVATMTVTQAARQLTLNANNTLTVSTAAAVLSTRKFPYRPGVALVFNARVRFNWTANGAVMECGFTDTTGTTAAVANGAFLRISATGNIFFGFGYASSEFLSPVLGTVGTDLLASQYYQVTITLHDTQMRGELRLADGSQVTATTPLTVDLQLPVSVPAVWNAIAVPVGFRVYNSTAPSTACTMIVSQVSVYSQGLETNKDWAQTVAGLNSSTLTAPAAGTQLANYANSVAPTSATLSNTAAGYTTLGGQWQFAAVAGAETDYALFAYAVPAGKTLYVTGIRIEAINTGAAVATTPTVLQWAVGRAAAATLASNSFRRTIGIQSFPTGAAVGAQASQAVDWRPSAPIVVESGLTFHVILKMPVGTATASQVVRGIVDVDGYFE